MNTQGAVALISILLVGIATLIPKESTTVAQPRIAAATATPDLPPEQPDIIGSQPDSGLIADPTRVGLVRDGERTIVVAFKRPIGVANSCQYTTCNSVVGSRWLGVDERTYVKLADGSFQRLATAQERAAGTSRPTGTWTTIASTAPT